MKFVQLIALVLLFNFHLFSSFKKGIYGSILQMKYQIGISIFKKNKKTLVIKNSIHFKDLMNQNTNSQFRISKMIKPYIPEIFEQSLKERNIKIKTIVSRIGPILKEERFFKEFVFDDEIIDQMAFSTESNFNSVQMWYDQFYMFTIKLCPNYLTKFEFFRNNLKLTKYFCYRFSSKLRRYEFFSYFFNVAVDFFGWTLTMAVEKHKDELKNIFDDVQINFNIFNYKHHEHLETQFIGFVAIFHKIIDKIYITFMRIQYKKMKTFDDIAKYLIARNPELKHFSMNIFLILYNVDFHNSEFVNSLDYLNFLEQHLKQEFEALQGSIHSISKNFVVDKFLIVEKHTECSFHQTYVFNRFLLNCAQILKKKSFNNILIGTCKLYYKKFFSQLKKYSQFCYFIKGNWKWWHELMSDLHLELTYVASKNEEINVNRISQSVLKKSVNKFNHIKKQIQKITGLSYINKKLFTYFCYFEQMLDEPEFENIIAASYRKFMINIEKFNPYDNQIMKIIKKDEQKFIEILNFRSKQIELIKEKLIKKLIYTCMIMSPLEYLPICKKIFYGINLEFFYQFDQLYFINLLLNRHITSEFLKYNYYQNNNSQMIAYFRKKFQSYVINIEKTLFRVINYFDKEIVDFLGQQKIFAIYMMQINLIQNVESINFADIVFKLQAILRQNNQNLLMKFNKASIKSYEFDSTLSEFAEEIYLDKNTQTYFPHQYDIFFIFLHLSSRLTQQEEHEFREDKDFLFLHFNQWNKHMKNVFNKNGQLVSKSPYLACKKHYPILDCYKNSLTLSIYTNKCPENSQRLNASNCVQKCPENFKQQGIFCIKPEIYVRKVYTNKKECGSECTIYDRSFWIRPCTNSYEELLLFCIPRCPMGSEDYGKTCRRKFIEKVKVFF